MTPFLNPGGKLILIVVFRHFPKHEMIEKNTSDFHLASQNESINYALITFTNDQF